MNNSKQQVRRKEEKIYQWPQIKNKNRSYEYECELQYLLHYYSSLCLNIFSMIYRRKHTSISLYLFFLFFFFFLVLITNRVCMTLSRSWKTISVVFLYCYREYIVRFDDNSLYAGKSWKFVFRPNTKSKYPAPRFHS
jgi:hypothetical protein